MRTFEGCIHGMSPKDLILSNSIRNAHALARNADAILLTLGMMVLGSGDAIESRRIDPFGQAKMPGPGNADGAAGARLQAPSSITIVARGPIRGTIHAWGWVPARANAAVT